jgi:tRNA threonylcarbamoyladenosine biosynthesis protein TsaE
VAAINLQYQLHQINEVAQQLLPLIYQHQIISINGNMGAGKTTLASAIINAFKSIPPASSPTYSIINEHQGEYTQVAVSLAHMDWYRLQGEAQLLDAGVMDYLHNGNWICLVEWASIAPQLLPSHLLIDIVIINHNTRQLHVQEVLNQ